MGPGCFGGLLSTRMYSYKASGMVVCALRAMLIASHNRAQVRHIAVLLAEFFRSVMGIVKPRLVVSYSRISERHTGHEGAFGWNGIVSVDSIKIEDIVNL
jgi:hypothetical protein